MGLLGRMDLWMEVFGISSYVKSLPVLKAAVLAVDFGERNSYTEKLVFVDVIT